MSEKTEEELVTSSFMKEFSHPEVSFLFFFFFVKCLVSQIEHPAKGVVPLPCVKYLCMEGTVLYNVTKVFANAPRFTNGTRWVISSYQVLLKM